MLSSKQPQATDGADLTQQLPSAAPDHEPASRIRYTKAELTDIAEVFIHHCQTNIMMLV